MSQILDYNNTYCYLEILPSDWHILLKLYAHKTIEYAGYYLIKNYMKWKRKEPNFNIKCLSLDDNWKIDGTFVMIVNNGETKKKTVFFNTLSDNLERLNKLLQFVTTKSDEKYLLFGYGDRLMPVVDAFMEKFIYNMHMHTISVDLFRVSKDVVAEYTAEPPAGIQLRNLNIENAATVNDIWPHRTKGSVEYVKRLIAYNMSVGAYDVDGKLLAWCLRLPVGTLGLLQVIDTHKRLGLGSLMVRYMAKKIAALGEEVRAGVIKGNTASRHMFENLGFQQIDNCYWSE